MSKQTADLGLTKREFCADVGSAALTWLGRHTLEKILMAEGAAMLGVAACAPTFKETRDQVTEQTWNVNPVIPVPADGCYAGLDTESAFWEGLDERTAITEGYRRSIGKDVPAWVFSLPTEQTVINDWQRMSGKKPAIHALGVGFATTFNNRFRRSVCDIAIQNGVVPLLKYSTLPFKGYRSIYNGECDRTLAQFAAGAREFGHPVLFVPFPEINASKPFVGEAGQGMYWGGESGKSAQRALQRMNKVFKDEGADNVVWVLQYLTDKCPLWRHPGEYFPGDFISWIGFTVRRRDGESLGPMEDILEYSYRWARETHRDKPVILVEMGSKFDQGNPRKQAEWTTAAYECFPQKFPGVRAALYSDRALREIGEDSHIGPETEMAIRQALTNPYFKEKVPLTPARS